MLGSSYLTEQELAVAATEFRQELHRTQVACPSWSRRLDTEQCEVIAELAAWKATKTWDPARGSRVSHIRWRVRRDVRNEIKCQLSFICDNPDWSVDTLDALPARHSGRVEHRVVSREEVGRILDRMMGSHSSFLLAHADGWYSREIAVAFGVSKAVADKRIQEAKRVALGLDPSTVRCPGKARANTNAGT